MSQLIFDKNLAIFDISSSLSLNPGTTRVVTSTITLCL